LKHDQERLQRVLGYRFQDGRLLQRALTHRSIGHDNNERLEYLGDALLNFVIGEAVFLSQAKASEGELSRLRATLVREETLAQVARRIDLGDEVLLGSGELKSGGFRRDSILADALEAVLGAVHLDGGFDAARSLCLRLFEPELQHLPDPDTLKDAKTRLQERLQAASRPLPEYSVLSEEGPPHQRAFRVRCRLPDSAAETTGEGASRKIAEQRSAERMLQELNNEGGRHA
jgi:ribonuclease III